MCKDNASLKNQLLFNVSPTRYRVSDNHAIVVVIIKSNPSLKEN